MNRIVKTVGIVVVVAALTAGGYLEFFARPVSAAGNSNLSTATVQRGTLTSAVSASGNVSPAEALSLTFQQSGIVQSVPVQVGDRVKAGQVLASVDTSALQLTVQNAQASVQAAQDNLTKAKTPYTTQDIASAQAALDAAQANYDKLTAPPSASDVTAAKASVASAQAAYNAAVATGSTSGSQLNSAAEAVQQAQAALQQAQAAYDKVSSAPNIGMLPQALTLQQDTIAYQTALNNYQSLQTTAGPNANSTVQQAKSQLDTALANLAKTETPNTPQDIKAAQDQVAQAQANLSKLQAGADAATVDAAQAGVTQAQIALKQAQLALQEAQIVAPFDGVVTAVNILPGSLSSAAGTAGALQIADLAHLQVLTNIAETDLPNVKVGQTVQITFDALPNANVQGTVTQVSPAGTLTQGVVNYPVTVQLNTPPASVKTGMTANLNIITAQKTNVLLVPNRAIRTVAAGTGNGNTTGSGGTAGNAGTAGSNGPNSAPNAGAGTASGAGRQGGAANGGNGSGSGAASGAGRQGSGSGNGTFQRAARQQYVIVLVSGQQVQVPVQTGLSNGSMTEIVSSSLQQGDVVVLNTTTTATNAARTGGGPGLGVPGVGRIGG